jgi:hypothetical protein
MKTASWVIVEKASGKAVFETFSKSLTEKVNTEKYTIIPILEYLYNLNKSIKANGNNQ